MHLKLSHIPTHIQNHTQTHWIMTRTTSKSQPTDVVRYCLATYRLKVGLVQQILFRSTSACFLSWTLLLRRRRRRRRFVCSSRKWESFPTSPSWVGWGSTTVGACVYDRDQIFILNKYQQMIDFNRINICCIIYCKRVVALLMVTGEPNKIEERTQHNDSARWLWTLKHGLFTLPGCSFDSSGIVSRGLVGGKVGKSHYTAQR